MAETKINTLADVVAFALRRPPNKFGLFHVSTPRPHYGPNWYAAYVRDPSGNKIGIVYNG